MEQEVTKTVIAPEVLTQKDNLQAVYTQPVMVSETVVRKPGSGKTWLACCLVLLVICCCSTLALGYLAVFQTGNLIKTALKSEKDTSLIYYTPDQVKAFDLSKYEKENPPKKLPDNKYEFSLSEAVFLNVLFNDPKNNYLAQYVGVKIKPDLMKVQIDAGSLVAIQKRQGNPDYANININPDDLDNIYVNIELTTSADHKTLLIKSLRLGDSGLDLKTLYPEGVKQIEDEVNASHDKVFDEVEFKDGSVRVILKDTNSIDNIKLDS